MSLSPNAVDRDKQPDEMPNWWAAEEVAKMATTIIREHHPHLVGAPIVYLFKKQASGKYAGMAQKRSDRERTIADILGKQCDFVITMAWDVWERLSPEERAALTDHELAHCTYHPDKQGELQPTLIRHDVEEFIEIIDRHGLWTTNLTQMAKTMKRTRKPKHLRAVGGE